MKPKTPVVLVLLTLIVIASLYPASRPSGAALIEVTYFDLVVDEPRQLLYASDRAGGSVQVISMDTLEVLLTVSVGLEPVGMDLSPDGSELAVALFGQAEIAILDLETLAVVSRLVPDVDSDPNLPYDVLYGRPGRLYTIGNPGSTGYDYVHVFDTVSRTEIGRSTGWPRAEPRLAMTADQNTLYVSQVSFTPQQIYRYDISTDTPVQTAIGPHGPVLVDTLCVMPDNRVYTSLGQVWSADLSTLEGTLPASGNEIECSPAAQRVYISTDTSIVAIDSASLSALYSFRLPPVVGPARLNEAETVLYASTGAGIRKILVDIQSQLFLPLVTRNYCHSGFDDFSNPASGWTVGEDDYARAAYVSGEYLVHTKQSGFIYLFRAPFCNFDNFTVQVDARWQGETGQSYGLIFNVQENFSSYYLFDMNTDANQYRLYRREPSGFTLVVPISYTSAIHAGTASNRLAVARSGGNISLYINDVLLGTWWDDVISAPGGTGIISSPYTDDPVSDALFDNFSVIRLPAPSAQAVRPVLPSAAGPEATPLDSAHEPAPAVPDW